MIDFRNLSQIIDWREVLLIFLLLLGATELQATLETIQLEFLKTEITEKFQVNLDFRAGRVRLALK